MHNPKDARPDKTSPAAPSNRNMEQNNFESADSGSSPSFVSKWLAGIPPADPHKARLAGQLQRTLGNSATRRMLQAAPPQIQRRAGDTKPDFALAEKTSIDVTGSYESSDKNGIYTIQLNQAGYHIQGWYQRRSYNSQSNSRQKQTIHDYRIEGDNVNDDPKEGVQFKYRLMHSTEGRQVNEGIMTFTQSDKTVHMSFNGIPLTRISTTPRPPEQALENLPDETRAVLEANVKAPLHSAEQQMLVHNAGVEKSKIREYFAAGRMMRSAIATKLDTSIEDTFGMCATEQLPLVLHTFRNVLAGDYFQSGSTSRPYWDWLHIIAYEQPQYTKKMQQRLGLVLEGDGKTAHKYRYAISATGLSGDIGIGAGVFFGEMKVEKLAPDQWSKSYWMVMGGVSAGPSAGITTGIFTRWTDFETLSPWAGSNFNGQFVIAGGQAGGSYGPGAGYGGNMITFYGDGALSPLVAPSVDFAGEIGVHIGAEVGLQWGYMGGSKAEVMNYASKVNPVKSAVPVEAGTKIFFPVNDPSLTDEGREVIKELSALNLSLIGNKDTKLQIDGYTSTTGSDARNDLLSQLRAQNTLQAIKDVTNDRFLIPEGNITVIGHGKKGAKDSGDEEGKENPDWRKVEVRLNGQLVLSMEN